ncbi:MAG: LysR family transcriptional regulator [Burkholderiaceae bacterium]
MESKWLEDFISLARTGSFTQAARDRNITQPALSRRIRALEIWAGADLIDRSGYPARLSAAGEEFLAVASDVSTTLNRARAELRNKRAGGPTAYRFAAPHSISIHFLAGTLHEMADTLPDVKTRILSDNLYTCCQYLNESACDFLLCFEHPNIAVSLDPTRFVRTALTQDRLIPVCCPSSDKSPQPRWQLGSAKHRVLPVLGYSEGVFFESVVTSMIKNRNDALRIRHVDALSEVLKRLAIRGAGVAWLPESSIRDELRDGRLLPAVSAGDDSWTAPLTLCLYTDPSQLDKNGRQIWIWITENSTKLQ